MPKLYLVGVTEDRTGLVLAKSPRAKSGESVLEIDGDVLDAIAEVRRYRSEGTVPPAISSPALPTRHRPTGAAANASNLSPREIQSRLRRGESIASVARRAGIEAWRIEVYAAPIAAEQARIVSRARELDMEKRGAGPSGRPLGNSVQANIVDKRVSMNVDEFESAWSAYEPEPDRWVVQFRYTSRGREQMAEWLYDPEEETITPANRLATTLGWRDPKQPGRLPPLPEAPQREPRAPKRKSTKATAKKSSAPSRKKAAAKRKSAKTSAKKSSAPSRKKAAAKRKSAKATAKRSSAPSRKKTSTKSTARKKAPPRKQSATKSASKKQQPAPKKQPAAKKQTKSAKKKPAPKKKPAAKKQSPGSGAGRNRSGTRSGRSTGRSSRGSSTSKRSKSPPAGGWREELARRMTDDERAGDDERRGSWRVVPRPDGADDADDAESDDLDLPTWIPAVRRDEAPVAGSPRGSEAGEIADVVDDDAGDARPTRSHVRVVGRPVSGVPPEGRRRRRFRRARRSE